jgi:hypothetical protein
MTGSPSQGSNDSVELWLEAQGPEIALAALRAERDRLMAQYERRIAEVDQAIERAEAIMRSSPAAGEHKPGRRKDRSAEAKQAPRRRPQARSSRTTRAKKPGGSK